MTEHATSPDSVHSRPSGQAHRFLVAARWLGSLALLALAPKCALCVAGYLGITTGLGVAGVELCGGNSMGTGFPPWTAMLLAVALIIFFSLLLASLSRAFSRLPVRNETGRLLK